SDNAVEVKLPFLNPAENLSIHLLLGSSISSTALPEVEVRAKGVTGKEETKDTQQGFASDILSLGGAAFAAISTLLATFTLITRRLKLHSELKMDQDDDDQRDIASYLLGIHGFQEEAHELRRSVRTMAYWSIADDLVERLLRSRDPDVIA